MTDRTEFDLAEGFLPHKITQNPRDSKALEAENNKVLSNNRLFSLGQEAIRRAAVKQDMSDHPSIVRGVQLYTVTCLQADPNLAYSRLYQGGRGARVAKRIADDILKSNNEQMFIGLRTIALTEMESGSPRLNIFLRALTGSIVLDEHLPKDDARYMLYGAALMRHVHMSGEREMAKHWWERGWLGRK